MKLSSAEFSVPTIDRPTISEAEESRLVDQLAARNRRRGYFRAFAITTDAIGLIVAYMVAGAIWHADLYHPQVLNTIGVMLPAYLLVGLNSRAFSLTAVQQLSEGRRSAVNALLITVCLVGLIVFLLKVSGDFSRAVFGIGSLAAILLLVATRWAGVAILRRWFGGTLVNELVIQDGLQIEGEPGTIIIDADRHQVQPRLNDPIILDRLGRYLRWADRVVVACPPEKRLQWVTALKGADVCAEVVAPELDEVGAIGTGRIAGAGTLVVATGPLAFSDQLAKRALDLFLVSLAMPVTLPLLGLVALAVKYDSRGPILFKQERVGLGNRIFRIYKFRSMYVDRTDVRGDRSACRDDDRITRVGRFIRRTSLDELPQILNVLTGVMSIVGPRPHTLLSKAEDRLFWDIDHTYWHRHAVKPGMTGLAQVRGFRGATETAIDLTNRLQADLEYLAGWSIWRDIRIIGATFRVVVHRNAF